MHLTVNFLEHEMPAFISPELWPFYSIDLNLLITEFWEKCSSRFIVHDVDELKQQLIDVWHGCRA